MRRRSEEALLGARRGEPPDLAALALAAMFQMAWASSWGRRKCANAGGGKTKE